MRKAKSIKGQIGMFEDELPKERKKRAGKDVKKVHPEANREKVDIEHIQFKEYEEPEIKEFIFKDYIGAICSYNALLIYDLKWKKTVWFTFKNDGEDFLKNEDILFKIKREFRNFYGETEYEIELITFNKIIDPEYVRLHGIGNK